MVRGCSWSRGAVRHFLHRTLRHAGVGLPTPQRAWALPHEQPRVRLLPHAMAFVIRSR